MNRLVENNCNPGRAVVIRHSKPCTNIGTPERLGLIVSVYGNLSVIHNVTGRAPG